MDEKMRNETLGTLLRERDFRKLKEMLCEMNEVDVAAFMDELDSEKTLVVFRMLPKELATDVFACLDPDQQGHIINQITDKEVQNIIEDLFVDDAVDMLEELPARVVKRVLKNAAPDTRNLINEFLQYPENSAGSVMTAEYIGLRKSMTVAEAIAYIRENGVDKETIYTCYVMDKKRRLEGVVTVKDLLMSADGRLIEDIMDTKVIKAVTTQDREEMVDLFNRYGLLSLPVVDHEDRLVGIVTVDDAVDVMEQEATEDFERMAAMLPSEKTYLKTGVLELAKNRIPWLLILMLSAMVTGSILASFEESLQAMPLLVSFIPMLMDTAGNAGAQSSTMMIRGMALGEVAPSDAIRILFKESRVALVCGAILGAVNFIRLMIQYPGQYMMCITVVISVFLTVIVAKIVGGLLPLGAKRIGLDPAMMASPIITTLVDAISIMLYFQLASAFLKL